jgi:rubredoxin
MTAFRKNVFAWACLMGASFLFGLGALYLSEFFLVPFFALIFSAKFVLDRITCPNCGTSVTYQGTFAGVKVSGGFIRRRCQQCGWDLDKELS